MSRYLLLFILNAPFVLAAILNTIISFKLKKISKRRATGLTLLWLVVLAGLALAFPIYDFLFSRELTQSEPLSLFDVVQITAIVILLFTTSRMRVKTEHLERRLNDLHQELSIRLTETRNQRR